MVALMSYVSSSLVNSARVVERSRARWHVGRMIKNAISPALTVAGWICMIAAASFWSIIAAFVVAGIACWAIEWGVRE